MSEAATPGHTRCTVVFVDRAQRSRVFGASWIECPTPRLQDKEYRRCVMELQRLHHGPSKKSCMTVLLSGDYTQAQACMALHAGLEPLGELDDA